MNEILVSINHVNLISSVFGYGVVADAENEYGMKGLNIFIPAKNAERLLNLIKVESK